MGAPSRAVVVSVLLLAVAGGALTAALPAAGPDSAADRTPAATAAGRTLVAALDRAWTAGDAAAFADLATDSHRGRRETRATWRALRQLGVDRLDLRWRSSTGAAAPPPGAAAAVVAVSWTQPGWAAPARTEVEVVFDHDGGLLDIAPVAGEPAPVWALAPLDVRRTPSGAVVVGLPGSGPIDRLARGVEDAAREVAATVSDGETALSVVAPATSGQLAALAGGADYAGVAAVIAPVDDSIRGVPEVHVLLNPVVFTELLPLASAVVLAHEVTHVVTGAAAARPLWVVEGFADLVALGSVQVPVRVAASGAIAAARQQGSPARLPTDADFETPGLGSGQAYEQAWLALRLLEQEAGITAIVRFHQAVVAGEPVAAALRTETGFGVAELTRMWRRELARLAGAGN